LGSLGLYIFVGGRYISEGVRGSHYEQFPVCNYTTPRNDPREPGVNNFREICGYIDIGNVLMEIS